MTKTYDWSVWRSMDAGEARIHPYLSQEAAEKLREAYQFIEDERRSRADAPVCDMPECFDSYYVKHEPKK